MLLNDKSGKLSSKRVFGAIGLSLSFASFVAIVIKWIITGESIDSQLVTLTIGVGTFSGGMLAAGVLEKE